MAGTPYRMISFTVAGAFFCKKEDVVWSFSLRADCPWAIRKDGKSRENGMDGAGSFLGRGVTRRRRG
jgi:hypothetical protein